MLQRPAIAVNSTSSLYVRARGIDGVEIWRMESERSVVIATIPMNQSVIGISWFSESQVALFGKNGAIKVYEVIDGEKEIKVEYIADSKLDLGVTLKSFVAFGRKVVFGDDNGSVWLAEFDSKWLLAKSHGHESSVDALVFSPDGSRIASAGRDKAIKIWSSTIPNDEGLGATHSQVLDFFSIAYDSSDESEVIIAPISSNEVLDFFSVAEDSEELEDESTLGSQDTIAEASPFSLQPPNLTKPDSPDLVNMDCLAVLEGGDGWAIALEFSSDSKRLVSGSMDNRVYLWDLENKALISSQEKHEGWVSTVAFSEGDKLIASGSWDKNICLYDGQTLEWIKTMEFHRDYVVDVEFQDSALYSASYDGLIAKWNLETYKIEEILDSDSDWIQAIRFLNNGTLISVCSDGSSVQWSLPTNEIVWKAGQALSAGIQVGESSEIYAYMSEMSEVNSNEKEFFQSEAEGENQKEGVEIETVEAPRESTEDANLKSEIAKISEESSESNEEMAVDISEGIEIKVEEESKTEALSKPVENVEESVSSEANIESEAVDLKIDASSKTEAISESFERLNEDKVSEPSVESEAVDLKIDEASKTEAISESFERLNEDEVSEPSVESEAVDLKIDEASKTEAISESFERLNEDEVSEPSVESEAVDLKIDEASKTEAISESFERLNEDEVSEPSVESEAVDLKIDEASKTEAISESFERLNEDEVSEPSVESEAVDLKIDEASKTEAISESFERLNEEVVSEPSIASKAEDEFKEAPKTEAISDSSVLSTESISKTPAKLEEASHISHAQSEADFDSSALGNDRSLGETSDPKDEQFRGGFISQVFKIDPESSIVDGSDQGGEDSNVPKKKELSEAPKLVRTNELSPLISTDIPSEVLDEMIDEIGGLNDSINDEWKAPFDQIRFGIPEISESIVSDVAPEPQTGEISSGTVDLLHESSEYRAISHASSEPENFENRIKTSSHEKLSQEKTASHEPTSEKKPSYKVPPPAQVSGSSAATIDLEGDEGDLEESTGTEARELTKRVHKLSNTQDQPRNPNEPVVPQGFQSMATRIEEVSPAEIFIQRRRSSSFGMGVVQKQEPIPTRFEKYVTIRTPHDTVYGIALSQDGSRIASCGDTHLCIWSSNGELIHKLDSPTAGLNAIMFTFDERIVVAAGDDGNIHIWFLPDEKQQIIQHAVLEANQVWVTNMDISADMRILISAGYDGTARIWDLSTGECIRTLSGHTGPVTGLSLGARTYTCGADGTIRVWNDRWKLIDEHHGFDKLTGIATHGTSICVTAANGDVFTLRNDKLVPLLRHRGEARTAKMRSDGVSASAGEDGLVMFYQPEFETPYAVIKLSTPIWDLAFNYEFCVIAGDDGRIYLNRAK